MSLARKGLLFNQPNSSGIMKEAESAGLVHKAFHICIMRRFNHGIKKYC